MPDTRTSIVLMGSLSAAHDCLRFLLDHPRLNCIAVVCRDDPVRERGEQYAIDLAREHSLPVHGLDTMPQADLGLAMRFDQVLRARHLERFERGVINLHGAPLPDMRGSMCECAAILEQRDEFGTSLHFMDTGVDTGALLCVERFEITRDATAGGLLREANRRGMALLRDNIDAIIERRIEPVPQDPAAGRTYRRVDLEAVRRAPLPLNPIARDRVRRAFHYGPAPLGGWSAMRRVAAAITPGPRA